MRRFFLSFCLVLGCGDSPDGRAQVPFAPPASAQLVLLFENEPAEFKGLTLNKAPFASLEVPMDAATIWPVPAGKQELAVSAPGAEDKKLPLILNPKQVALLVLGLKPNPDPAKQPELPKIISAEVLPLDLPAPDKQGRVFVFIPPNGKTLQASEMRGKANPKAIELKAGRVTSLGVGSVAVMVGEQQVVAADPGNPGLYVFVILAGKDGKLRSVPFNFLVEEPEAPASPKK
jgi:hypothetical protein